MLEIDLTLYFLYVMMYLSYVLYYIICQYVYKYIEVKTYQM